ncbi:MAG TPA: HAD-IB family hydrolase [Mycobacteriales bacterium]|nr:HAD-IB family hydrolase [Mycobacteriales bacterium]
MPRRRTRKAVERARLAGEAAAAAAEVPPADPPVPPAAGPTVVLPDRQAAAFFDVDNTMMRGASIYYFARGLAARHFFSSRDLAAFAFQQVKFRIGGRESHGDMVNARESALAFVAGKDVAEITTHAEDIYDELMAERIWSGTRALAEAHLGNGQRVWLVTAAPIELASIISHRLGLTGALGTVSEIADGVYTGHLVGEPLHGPAKAAAVQALAIREGLELDRCAAYSDSINDLPMLQLVGRPVAVNPDAALRAHAREAGWEIRDFRTGRKAAKIGVPATLAGGLLAGGAVVLAARRRAHRSFLAQKKADLRRSSSW